MDRVSGVFGKASQGVSQMAWLALGTGLCFSIYFFNLGFMGFGPFLGFFALLSFICLVGIFDRGFRLYTNRGVTRTAMWHILFGLIMAFAFMKNGSRSVVDARYLLEHFLNVVWWPMIFMLTVSQRKLTFYSIKTGYMGLSIVIIFSWIVIAAYSGDVFFLRNEDIEMELLQLTMLKNPNRFSRVVMILMAGLYFFYLVEGRLRGKSGGWVLGVILILGALVVTSLSRANLIGLMIFAAIAVASRRRIRISIKGILSAGVVSVMLSGLMIIAVPGVRDRLWEGSEQIRSVIAGIESSKDTSEVEGRRIRNWIASLNIIRDKPMYGIGVSKANEYLAAFGSVMLSKAREGEVIKVHGGFLRIAVYGGIASLIGFLMFYTYLIRAFLRSYVSPFSEWNRCAALCGVILLAVLVPGNIGADCFEVSFTWMSLGYLFANSMVRWKKEPEGV